MIVCFRISHLRSRIDRSESHFTFAAVHLISLHEHMVFVQSLRILTLVSDLASFSMMLVSHYFSTVVAAVAPAYPTVLKVALYSS